MTVYCIALLNFADRERYGADQRGFMAIFNKYSGKLLAVDETPTIKEGDWPHTRTVLIEFPDADASTHGSTHQRIRLWRSTGMRPRPARSW